MNGFYFFYSVAWSFNMKALVVSFSWTQCNDFNIWGNKTVRVSLISQNKEHFMSPNKACQIKLLSKQREREREERERESARAHMFYNYGWSYGQKTYLLLMYMIFVKHLNTYSVTRTKLEKLKLFRGISEYSQ